MIFHTRQKTVKIHHLAIRVSVRVRVRVSVGVSVRE